MTPKMALAKIDGFAKSHRSRHPGESRGPEVLVLSGFPRRRESSIFGLFWTPASAGVTALRTFYERIKISNLIF